MGFIEAEHPIIESLKKLRAQVGVRDLGILF